MQRVIPQKEREEMYLKGAVSSAILAPIFGVSVPDSKIVNFFFGEWNIAMYILLALTAIDILTGVAKGLYDKRLRSRKMSQGMIRKLMIWVVVVVANFTDVLMFDGMPIARTGAVLFYIGMEGISICENLAMMDVTVPKFIGKYLEVIKEKGENPEPTTKEQKVDEIKIKINEEEIKLKTKDEDLTL